MSSWCWLCRKHFEQEKDKLQKKKCSWCSINYKLKKSDHCDYKDCFNKPYREIYEITVKIYPNWFITLMRKIDFRYRNCSNCGWDYGWGRFFEIDCPKHGLKWK